MIIIIIIIIVGVVAGGGGGVLVVVIIILLLLLLLFQPQYPDTRRTTADVDSYSARRLERQTRLLFSDCGKRETARSPVTLRPPRWPSGKASASRAEDPGFESRLRRDFFGVESYQ